MKKICIIGGSQKETYERIGMKKGYKVVHHNGKTGGGNIIKQILPMIRKADVVILMKGALNHHAMWKARELAEKRNIPIYFHQGFGASGAFDLLPA